MSLNIRNASPRPILRGINDLGGRTPVYEPEQIPTHLPLTYLFTERGPTTPELGVGDFLARTYGSRTFDHRSEFVTHATPLANEHNAAGNAQLIQRLVPPGANPPSSLRLYADLSCDMLPVYERGPDGKFKLDDTGAKIPTGAMVEACRIKWTVKPTILDADDGRLLESGNPRLNESGEQRLLNTNVGKGIVRPGSMTNSAGEVSSLYPIMDFEAAYFGSYGDNLGIRFSAPTTESVNAVDDITIEEQRAYLFRLQFVEKSKNSSSAKVLETLFGERSVDFTFKDGVINPRTDKELSIDKAVVPAYSQEAVNGMPKIGAPIKQIHVYDANLDLILTTLAAKEATNGNFSADPEDRHMLNIFSGHDYNNVPYESVRVVGPSEGGVILNENTTHYLGGGYDGVMNFSTFDLAVQHQVLNFGDLENKMLDSFMYPCSVIYDTGFTLETKKALFVPMGRRKDLYVVASTQDVSLPQNTPSQENSIATALRTAARMYPESEIYGTSTVRVLIIPGSGYLLNSTYKGLLPLTVEIGAKSAAYMGAGTGIWKENLAFDETPNNQVKMFKGTNATWKSVNARERDWEVGMSWAQTYDRQSLFFPAFQTAYDDDSSPLNSAINMIIAVELEKVAERAWRDLTGISSLTPGQFVERSNRLIENDVKRKFDGRVIIVPETNYTPADTQRGYSWSCNIHMYAPNMKTVGSFTIVSHRIEDYAG